MKKPIESKEAVLLKTLLRFFKKPENLDAVVPVLTETDSVSLRVLDWFVTNYSREFTKQIMKDPILYCFDVYNSYKSQLKAFNKKMFDPFCRIHSQTCSPLEHSGDPTDSLFEYIATNTDNDDLKVVPLSSPSSPSSASSSSSSSSGKFYLQYGKGNHQKVLTTIGQLNFFRWAIENRVLEYVNKHADTIKADLKLKEGQKKHARSSSNMLLPTTKHLSVSKRSSASVATCVVPAVRVTTSGYIIVFD